MGCGQTHGIGPFHNLFKRTRVAYRFPATGIFESGIRTMRRVNDPLFVAHPIRSEFGEVLEHLLWLHVFNGSSRMVVNIHSVREHTATSF